MMRRKETSLLVESWRNFINEMEYTVSDSKFKEEYENDINKLDSQTMLKVPSEMAGKGGLNLVGGKAEMKKDGSYRIDFIIFNLLHDYVSKTHKNQILKYASTYNPGEILLQMINHAGDYMDDFEKKIDSYKEEFENENFTEDFKKLKVEFGKYKNLIKAFKEFKYKKD